MKQVILSLLTIALTLSSAEAAKWRVNNRTGIDADFTDFPAAVSAASAGDTIYIEPSAASYNGTSVTKRLTIIGNGYYLGNTTNNMGLQADTNSSAVSTISFNTGSGGSVLMGISMAGNYSYIYIGDTSITVKRNAFHNYQNYLYLDASKADIRQNYFYNYSRIANYSSNPTASNINIQNNIFFYYSGISFPSNCSGFIQNNMFDQGSVMSCFNFQINNNIMVGGSFTVNNCVFFNNIGDGTQFPNAGSGSNNLQNITTTALFTNYTATTETRYTLAPSGPGIGAGFNSVDCGVFGGPDPYKLSGIPPFPTIYSLSAPNTTTSGTLPVTISTRSNN